MDAPVDLQQQRRTICGAAFEEIRRTGHHQHTVVSGRRLVGRSPIVAYFEACGAARAFEQQIEVRRRIERGDALAGQACDDDMTIAQAPLVSLQRVLGLCQARVATPDSPVRETHGFEKQRLARLVTQRRQARHVEVIQRHVVECLVIDFGGEELILARPNGDEHGRAYGLELAQRMEVRSQSSR